MKLASFAALVEALDGAGVRYLVTGGIALNVHGYLRYTKDVDLVIRLVPENVERTFGALASIGYRPDVPIATAELADAVDRQRWLAERGAHDLAFSSDAHRETPVRVLARELFPFDEEHAHALVKRLGKFLVRVVSIRTLISMKEGVGRAQDVADAHQLRVVLQEPPKTAPDVDGIDWSLTTWDGSRREQLRRWAELSLEEILRAQEEMADLNRRFAEMRVAGKFFSPRP